MLKFRPISFAITRVVFAAALTRAYARMVLIRRRSGVSSGCGGVAGRAGCRRGRRRPGPLLRAHPRLRVLRDSLPREVVLPEVAARPRLQPARPGKKEAERPVADAGLACDGAHGRPLHRVRVEPVQFVQRDATVLRGLVG